MDWPALQQALHFSDTNDAVAGLIRVGFITNEQIVECVQRLLPFYQHLGQEVFNARLLALIMTTAYFDNQTLMRHDRLEVVRQRVAELFEHLGLGIEMGQPGYQPENQYLFQSIIRSIKLAADFEELDSAAQRSPSSLYVITNDDLEKEARLR